MKISNKKVILIILCLGISVIEYSGNLNKKNIMLATENNNSIHENIVTDELLKRQTIDGTITPSNKETNIPPKELLANNEIKQTTIAKPIVSKHIVSKQSPKSNAVQPKSENPVPASSPILRSYQEWDVIGDSITALNNYQYKVQSKVQIKNINLYGISGTCITALNENDINSMSIRVSNISHSADLISVFGGTNDYGTSKPLGNKNDSSVTTFYGALKNMLNKLKTQNPKAKIVMFTPLQRNWHGQEQIAGMGNNLDGHSLIDYVNAIKDVCSEYGIPVLDLYNTSGITIQNIDEYTKDGLHPNEAGFVKISEIISNFLNNLN